MLPRALILLAALGALAACRVALPPAGGAAGPATRPDTLRVAGFNAWILPLASVELSARMRKMPQAIAAFDADVICFQEVWTYKEDVAKAFVDLPHAAESGGGLLTLSRFPIVSSSFTRFPRFAGLSIVERCSGKGVLDAVIRTPKGDVRVVNSHLSLDLDPESVPRLAQLDVLIRVINRRKDLPVILSADLNTPSVRDGARSPEYLSLTHTAALSDAKPLKHLGGENFDPGPPTRVGWPRTFEPILFRWAPDYLMFRDGPALDLRLSRFQLALHTPNTALSDHNLLLGTWTLHPAEGR